MSVTFDDETVSESMSSAESALGGLVIFDCDGVLVDSEVLVARVEAEMLVSLGVDVTEEEILASFVGLSEADMHGLVERRWGVELTAEFAAAKWERIIEAIDAGLEPVAGIDRVIDSIDGPRCVASSSAPERIVRSLTRVGLIDRFDGHLYSSKMVANGKPAPDLFLFAADKLGVMPNACVVIEDSPFGVQAAVAAGMVPIGFTAGSHCRPDASDVLQAAGAEAVVDDADALLEVLGSIRKK